MKNEILKLENTQNSDFFSKSLDDKRKAKKIGTLQKLLKHDERLREDLSQRILNSKGNIMNLLDVLKIEVEALQTVTSFTNEIEGSFNNILYHINKSAKTFFGDVSTQGTKSMSGSEAPEMKTIRISENQTLQIPFGKITLNKKPWGEDAYIDMSYFEGIMLITINCKKMFQNTINDFIIDVTNNAQYDSIYCGKSLMFKNGDFTFKKLVGRKNVIYSPQVDLSIKTIEARIKDPKKVAFITGKTTEVALFAGTYGTGKTQTTNNLMVTALENGWTVVISSNKDLMNALNATQRITNNAGTLFIVEDADMVLTAPGGIRSEISNDLGHILDGNYGLNTGKTDTNSIIIFTTNHVERLEGSLLRGGRISAISFETLSRELNEKLINSYLESKEYSLTKEEMNTILDIIMETKFPPSTIISVLENSIITALIQDTEIKGIYILTAIEKAVKQLEFHNKALELERKDKDKDLATIFKSDLGLDDINSKLEKLQKDIDHLQNSI